MVLFDGMAGSLLHMGDFGRRLVGIRSTSDEDLVQFLEL